MFTQSHTYLRENSVSGEQTWTSTKIEGIFTVYYCSFISKYLQCSRKQQLHWNVDVMLTDEAASSLV